MSAKQFEDMNAQERNALFALEKENLDDSCDMLVGRLRTKTDLLKIICEKAYRHGVSQRVQLLCYVVEKGKGTIALHKDTKYVNGSPELLGVELEIEGEWVR